MPIRHIIRTHSTAGRRGGVIDPLGHRHLIGAARLRGFDQRQCQCAAHQQKHVVGLRGRILQGRHCIQLLSYRTSQTTRRGWRRFITIHRTQIQRASATAGGEWLIVLLQPTHDNHKATFFSANHHFPKWLAYLDHFLLTFRGKQIRNNSKGHLNWNHYARWYTFNCPRCHCHIFHRLSSWSSPWGNLSNLAANLLLITPVHIDTLWVYWRMVVNNIPKNTHLPHSTCCWCHCWLLLFHYSLISCIAAAAYWQV